MPILQLQALAPADPPRLQAVKQRLPEPAAHEVQVRLIAASVNPIDAKRATGYGQRLLSLKKAGTFPLVLGNDLVGDIVAVGAQVQGLAVGQRVIGLRPTHGHGGTHASGFNLDAALLRPLPPGCDPVATSTLPYSYTTARLALAGAGLNPAQAAGLQVMVHGASGALGQLAVRTLHAWGVEVTAICRGEHAPLCLSLGATSVVDRDQAGWRDVSARFDATLNFASWDDERWLLQRLKHGALGHASTVHPLLGHFDHFGWWRGAGQAWRAYRSHRALAQQVAGPACRYAWTVFRPDAQYLDALLSELQQVPWALPLGLQVPLAQGQRAFEHVLAGRTGRAVLLGDAAATAFSETFFSGITP
jgi:D-arabinose 1-dehydrogenase-like Zn-dependent alcohol dehydrogenase